MKRTISALVACLLLAGCLAKEGWLWRQPPKPASAPDRAGTLRGSVVSVIDGDTIDVLTPEKKTVRIRLHGIDAPEKAQAYGLAAKECAAKACAGAEVTAVIVDRDRYGRTVADVCLPDGRNLNRVLVAAGMAWWENRYAPKDSILRDLEASARADRRGLWSALGTRDPPIRPRDFRAKRGRK